MNYIDAFKKNRLTKYIIDSILLFLLSILVYSQFGLYGKLLRDDAVFAYSGQQLIKGVPPYISIFQPKTPLWAFFTGISVIIANWLNLPDIISIRIVFLILSCLCVVAIYWLSITLFPSRKIAILAAIVFVGFFGFGIHAGSGPRAKTLATLFVLLSLIFTTKKMWFRAGIFGSLAFLSWQPMLILPAISITLSFIQTPTKIKLSTIFRSIAGFMIPVILTFCYFLIFGGVHEFIDDAFIFPIKYMERKPIPVSMHILNLLDAIFKENVYASSKYPILFGYFMMVILTLWRLTIWKKFSKLLTDDTFAFFITSFFSLLFWSILDFQGYPDYYVLLPYFATSFSWMIITGVTLVMENFSLPRRLQNILFIGLYLFLILFSLKEYQLKSNNFLDKQIEWSQQIEKKYLNEGNELLSIARPEILVLLNRTNSTRHIVINSGEHNIINNNYEDGISGWLTDQMPRNKEEYPVIILGNADPPEAKKEIERWLKDQAYEKEIIGWWTVYSR